MPDSYTAGMDERAVTALVRNVRALMADAGDSQVVLAKRANVSQRAISDLINYETLRKSPTLRTVAKIAGAYDVPAWALMLPGLEEAGLAKRVAALLQVYVAADPLDRDMIDRVAASASRHAVKQPLAKTG